MKYLKVWTDFEKILAPLEFDEIGRLFLFMLHYAATGEEPGQDDFSGNESFLWPVAKRDIDTMAEKSDTLRQNGLKGGRPKTKQNQTKANLILGFDEKPNESLKEKKRNEMKGNEMKSSSVDDADFVRIQHEHDEIITAAENAGFDRTESVRAKLIELFSEYGREKMLSAIESCVEHGAPKIAYLKAVLSGKPGKKSDSFEQRDYSNAQAEAMKRMMEDTWGEEGVENA